MIIVPVESLILTPEKLLPMHDNCGRSVTTMYFGNRDHETIVACPGCDYAVMPVRDSGGLWLVMHDGKPRNSGWRHG